MSKVIAAHFDGKVLIPEKPVKLPVGKRLRIQVDVDEPANGKQTRKRRKVIGTGKFRSGISDLATNRKHMEGFGTS
jgi:predicted DNA-binding antitoxin AbrB/MazE fold protein